jgi:hypothetical protein
MNYEFKLNHEVHSEDDTLSVLWITASWKHGIYGTQEHEHLSATVTEDGAYFLRDDGSIVVLSDPNSDDDFGVQLCDFIDSVID